MATVHVWTGGTWTIVLSSGQVQTWWWTWGFNSNQWVRMDACPDSDNSKVQILAEWAEKDLFGNVRRLVTYKNNGATTVAFRPKIMKAW